jgi:hypothetical protein
MFPRGTRNFSTGSFPCRRDWEVADDDSIAYALNFAANKLHAPGVSLEQCVPLIHMGA